MYKEPCAKIQIGTDTKYLEFTQVNKIEIEETVKELGNKATITLPRNYKALIGKNVLDLIKTGDAVTIWLGENEEYFEEFTGFLQNIESGAPLKLTVDDEFYPLKRNSFKKTFEDGTKLRTVLQYIAPGYLIECPDVTVCKFMISNVSSFRVLRAIKEQYGFYSKLKGNVLKCMWPYEMKGISHTYTFYTPTVKKSDLKYHRAEDVKIKIKAVSNQRNGSKLTYETGSKEDEASIRSLNFGILTQDQLNEYAEREYKRIAFDGYSGSITGFGMPRTHAGDILEIKDNEEPNREGRYLIDACKITYDPFGSGVERQNTLSFKV